MVAKPQRGAAAEASADSPPPGETPPAPPSDNAGEKPPEQAAPVGAIQRTPADWGHRKGNLFAPSERQPWVEVHARNFHAEADALHRWSEHAHHFQPRQLEDGTVDPTGVFVLTEADYEKALEAAAGFPACGPHKPALAPFKGRSEPEAVQDTRAKALAAAKEAKAKRAEQRKAMR